MKKYFAIVPFYKEDSEEFLENQISDLSSKDEIRDFCTIEKAIKYAEKMFKVDKKYVINKVKIFKTTYCYDMRRFYQCTIERNSQTLLIAKKL